MSARCVLVATVRLHGAPVREVRVAAPKTLVLSRSGALGLPLPEGVESLGRVSWERWDRAVVTDADGGLHHVEPGGTVALGLGGVEVELQLARQLLLRRALPWGWAASLVWLVIFSSANLGACSGRSFVRTATCTWLGDLLWIPCPTQQPPPGGGGSWNAELLARLLRKDFEGEADGVIQQVTPKHVAKFEVEGYMPAGDAGPITEMGGAEQVTPTPQRKEKAEASLPAAPKKVDAPKVRAEPEDGVALLPPEPADAEGEGEDPEGVAPDGEEPVPDPSQGRSEEKQGWGVRDWIDAAPPEDKRIVDLSKRSVERKLRLDPDDLGNLGLVAYYQYLQEDYENAEKSFDRLIELDPNESAGYNNKALVYKRRGEYAKEEGLYRVALAMEPDEPTAMSNLAVNMAHQKRYAEAFALMDKVEKITPEDPYCDLHRAKIHAAMGQDEQAISYLRIALGRMTELDIMHHIEFRQDIRLDPVFSKLRADPRFIAVLEEYYGGDSPVGGGR
jgi:hypothetical protein